MDMEGIGRPGWEGCMGRWRELGGWLGWVIGWVEGIVRAGWMEGIVRAGWMEGIGGLGEGWVDEDFLEMEHLELAYNEI